MERPDILSGACDSPLALGTLPPAGHAQSRRGDMPAVANRFCRHPPDMHAVGATPAAAVAVQRDVLGDRHRLRPQPGCRQPGKG